MSVSVRTVTELYMLRFSFNVSRISNSFDRLSSFQTKGKKVLQHYEENAFDVFLIDQQKPLMEVFMECSDVYCKFKS